MLDICSLTRSSQIWVSFSFLQHPTKGCLLPAAVVEHAPLQHVYIFFDTATFDEIERDVKVMLHVRHYFQQQKNKKNIGNARILGTFGQALPP